MYQQDEHSYCWTTAGGQSDVEVVLHADENTPVRTLYRADHRVASTIWTEMTSAS